MKIVNVEIIESYSRTVAIEIPDNIELEDQNNYITEQAHKEYQMSENKGSKSVLFKFEDIGEKGRVYLILFFFTVIKFYLECGREYL